MSSLNNSKTSDSGSNGTPTSAAARAGSFFLSLWRKTSRDPKQPQVYVCEHCQQEHLTEEKAAECEANCCQKPRAIQNSHSELLSDEVMAFQCEICKKLFSSEVEAEGCEAQCQLQEETRRPRAASELIEKHKSTVETDNLLCTTNKNKSKVNDDHDDDNSSSSSDEDDDVLDLKGIRSLAQPSDVVESAEPVMGLNAGFTQTMGELPFSLDQDDPLFHQSNDSTLGQESPDMDTSSIDENGEKNNSALEGKSTSSNDTTTNTPAMPQNLHDLDNSEESLHAKTDDKESNIDRERDSLVVAYANAGEKNGGQHLEIDWDSMFDRLTQFQTEFGHLYVKEEEEPDLSAWMEEQRKNLGRKLLCGEKIESEVERERVVRLESIAFPWTDGLLSADWNSMYDELVRFHKKAGHTNVPAGLGHLCNWVKCQRNYLAEKRKRDCCDEDDLEAIARLDKLGFQWPPLSPKRILPSSESIGIRASGRYGVEPHGIQHGDTGQNDDEISANSIDSSEDEMPRDYPETFRRSWLLEKQIMRKVKLDILKRQEAEFMEMCHFDICRQEEEEVMTMIREDIETAETQKAVEILERNRRRDAEVLEVSFVDDGTEKFEILLSTEAPIPLQLSVEWGTPPEKHIFDESEAYRCAKIIPKSYRGYPFFDGEKDRAQIAKAIVANCLVRVLSVDHDPNSCLIAIICDQWESAYCLDQLNSWLKRRRMSVMARILSESGREIEVDWDTGEQAKLGVTVLANSWERKKLLMVPRANGQVVGPLREVMKDGCVLLEAVDGIQMNTTGAFKEHITPRVQVGAIVRLSCKVFDESSMQHDDVNVNQTNHNTEEEDEDVPMEVGDVADNESNVIQPQDDETTTNEANVASSEKEASASGSIQDLQQRNHEQSKAGYNHFKAKYKRLVELEFSESGIHVNTAISQMWTNHKKILGSHCDDSCPCPYDVHNLCQNMVRDLLKKNPTWSNPLGLSAGDIPVGFATFFCPKMTPSVKEKYPEGNPHEHLNLLCRLWRKHESNMAFGTKCSRDCDCETAWDTIFQNVGQKKRCRRTSTTLVKDHGHESSKLQKKSRDEPLSRELAKEVRKRRRTEYCVAFKTKEPLGFYFVNEQREDGHYCVISSVFPLGRDERIRRGTTVVAVEKKTSGRIAIDSYEKLRNLYCRYKSTGEDIHIVFINLQDDDDLEALRGHRKIDTDVWTKHGKWKGRSNLGWPGGANLLRRQARSSQIIGHGTKETENLNSAPTIGLSVPKTIVLPRTTEANDVWTKTCVPRRLLQKRPRSIVAGARGSSDRPRRLQFSQAQNETRQFEAAWPASYFLVKSRRTETLSDHPSEPRITGTKRQSTISHQELNKRFKPAVQESPIAARETIRNEGSLDRPRVAETQTSQSPSELAELLPQAVKSGTFLGLLQLLQNGAAMEMDSSKPIKSLLEIVKPKKEMGVHDFVMKDKILKCWITTIEIGWSASALKHMSRVFISAQKVSISDPSLVKLEAGEDLAISWLVSGRNRARKDCSRSITFPRKTEFIFPVTSQTRPFEFTWNGVMERDSQVEVSIFCENKFTGEKRLLGTGSKRIQDIFKRSEQNVVQIDVSCGSRVGIVAEVVITDFRLSELEKFHKILRDKRSDLCRGLNKTVLDTIERFNTENESHWGKDAYLSVEVPANGTNLLETAIKLADDKTVKRLLKMGAKVTKKALEFAEGEKLSPLDGCGTLLVNIVDILKEHYEQSEKSAISAQPAESKQQVDQSERVSHGPEFSRVGRDWLFSLDKMIHSKFKKRCRNVEHDGYCRFGPSCFYGHVCQPGDLKSFTLFPPREFKDHLVEIRTVNDKWGDIWYTGGYRDGNNFYYSWKKGGIEYGPSGIWWYKTREDAIEAVKSLVVGQDDSMAPTQLPDPNFTLL